VVVDRNAGVALFVSAHLDDAVFSCGGTLSLLQRQGWRTFVATVCTETVEYEQAGFADCVNLAGAATVEAGLARRREEDRRAGRELGFLPLHLGLSDASFRQHYRLRDGTASMFIDPSNAADDPYQPLVTEAIRDCIDCLQPNLVFAPAGYGDHVDHLLARNACIEYTRVATAIIVWYQDLPYGLAAPDVPPIGLAADVRPEVISFEAEDLQRKCDASAAYASQVHYFPAPDWRAALARHARSLESDQPGERVWRSD
jgi:LmbE family N-acetylglucosaminyl deacetylase